MMTDSNAPKSFPRRDFEERTKLRSGAATWLRWRAAFKSILVAR
jgi:hypothetical protein